MSRKTGIDAIASETIVVGNQFIQAIYHCQFVRAKKGVCTCLETRGVYQGRLIRVEASFLLNPDNSATPIETTSEVEEKLKEKLEKCFCGNCMPRYPYP